MISRRSGATFVVSLATLMVGCATTTPKEEAVTSTVDREALAKQARATLDDFHAAASVADGARYFGHFAADGVFLGTDATERWTVDAFRAYAKPYFDKGRGWTYKVVDRHLDVDRAGAYAWFDEALENAKLCPCRGSGVLRREGDAWKIVQYNLTIPIPNALAEDFAERIRREAR